MKLKMANEKMNKLEKLTLILSYGLVISGLSIGALLFANKKPNAGVYTTTVGMIGGLVSAGVGAISYESRNRERNYQI